MNRLQKLEEKEHDYKKYRMFKGYNAAAVCECESIFSNMFEFECE